MVECNIDARGKAARLLGGVSAILAASIFAILLATNSISIDFGWYAIAGAYFGGAFAIFEARAGWCVVRAMGIKTPL
ncbi:MAG: hypothetical protein ISP83_05725 [Candidatus Poseidonia sp.]|nr:hypothetical protein [Poseidonia sp.]MBL6748258.1 hypothetical protein [Poseidonia sp.]MBL6807121.1 hypothetical protein [Poseidonia sp.]MBL6886212.1 hypothetical protein [Poseidonia sp.]MBL6893058.1 hypothetical protein [Poseidonia sp.]